MRFKKDERAAGRKATVSCLFEVNKFQQWCYECSFGVEVNGQIAAVEVAGSVSMVIFEEIVKTCVFNIIQLFHTHLCMCTLLRELCLCELM